MSEKQEPCIHIYQNIGSNICPHCGDNTHETDWELFRKQQKEHREKHGFFYNVLGWWSI